MSRRRQVGVIVGVGVVALAGVIVYLSLRGDPGGIFARSGQTDTTPGRDQQTSAPPPPPLPPGVVSHCGDHKYVALTFDDGPFVANNNVDHVPATARVLDELHASGITATFFLSPGSNGGHNGDSECELVRRMLREGHEVQWHTWNHVDLVAAESDVALEVKTCRDWITNKCTVPASKTSFTMLRPPFGSTTPENDKQLNGLGLTSVIWNVDSNDWKGLNADQIRANIETQSSGKASKLILMHDMWYHSGMIGWIKQRFSDHEFVTVSKCYQDCGSPTDCFQPLP